MTPEERFERIERLMAQMAARQAYHDEAHERHAERQEKLEERLDAFVASVHEMEDDFRQQLKELLTSQVLLNGKMGDLARAQEGVAQAQRELSDSIKHTDERLAALIDIVMRQPPPTT